VLAVTLTFGDDSAPMPLPSTLPGHLNRISRNADPSGASDHEDATVRFAPSCIAPRTGSISGRGVSGAGTD
jgi:hypothetical protein